jgi:hypothetical protein
MYSLAAHHPQTDIFILDKDCCSNEKIYTLFSRMGEVDQNLNYMLGQLSLVVQEFNQVSITQCDCATTAGIYKESMRAMHRVGIGLSYRPARLNRLAEFIPRNRLRGSIHV